VRCQGHCRDETSLALVPDSPSSEGSLGIRVEIIDDAIFSYRLRFLDAERKDSGLWVELQPEHNVDQFFDALRSMLPLDAEDTRKNHRATT
jgi:hypothetical protein